MKKHLIYILFLCSICRVHAQKDIIEYKTAPATSVNVACKGFSLQPDFNFKATATSSMSFSINSSACSVLETATSISSNQNYIVTLTPLGQTQSVSYKDGKITVDRKIEGDVEVLTQIQYFDGLGRPVQTVQRGITPLRSDLVTYQEYDSFGREERSWMPSVAAGNNGAFMPLATVKTKAFDYYKDSISYSKPIYETSPLNRVLEQYGPGVAWKTAGASVKTTYLTNVASGDDKLICSLFTVDGEGLKTKVKRSGNYAANELYVTETQDEQGNLSYEFKDKSSKVVLTRQINFNKELNITEKLETYYVYDGLGNLCFVLPPMASEILVQNTGSWDNTNSTINQYGYIYLYDENNRCVGKKLPGADWVYTIYDWGNRPIFTQDGEQRLRGEWLFSIPDAFGRIVLTGTCKNTLLDYNNISIYNFSCLKYMVVKGKFNINNTANKYYDITGVTLVSPTILTANYYDDYSFKTKDDFPKLNYNVQAGYPAQHTNSKGLLTGSIVALFDGSDKYLYTALYYDYKGNMIQSKSTNHLEGIESEYIAYTFSGSPTKKLHTHTANGKATQTELYTYTYDHAGRMTTTKHKLNSGAEVILAQNIYNELGQLSTTTANNQPNLKVTYAYNIRSWTKSITNPLFSQALYYEESYGGSAKQYNGNISAMSWKLQNDTGSLGYAFAYDNLSRLTKATYLVNGSVYTNGYETSYAYDKMGNMKTLTSNGLKTNSPNTWGIVDHLTMTYTGNQLIQANDTVHSLIPTGSMDFKDYSKAAIEYTYNRNGAMTQDLNKGISKITYNSLNLPRLMDIMSPLAEARNEYIYSATGTKLKVIKKWNSNYSKAPVMGTDINPTLLDKNETTDYVGNIIYENGVLKRILTNNGYIEGNIYYFYVKDHLGDNRVTAKADGTLVQATHFYPFGSSFAVAIGTGVQPYKYNGKELDVMHGVNEYDYSARYYDPAKGSFDTMDPMAEKYYNISPYVYCANNPIKYIDPDGKIIGTVVGALVGGIAGAIDAQANGRDVWAGVAEGAVSGGVTGAVFDVLVGSAIATGGTSLILGAAIVTGTAGVGLGTIAGDQVGQVTDNVRSGQGLSKAVSNTKPTPNGKIIESIKVGLPSTLLGGIAGSGLSGAAQVATKGAQSSLSKSATQATKALQSMGASQSTIDNAVGKITIGMSQVESNVKTSEIVVNAATTTTIESGSKILQSSIQKEQKTARLKSVIK